MEDDDDEDKFKKLLDKPKTKTSFANENTMSKSNLR